MSTELVEQISKEEIDWVKSKHVGLQKAARRILKDAIEIGQWFIEAEQRMGIKRNGKGGTWLLWLRATFPEMHVSTIGNYTRLARGRDILEQELNLSSDSPSGRRDPPSIKQALRLLSEHDREEKEELESPPTKFEEPLLILRDELKSYVFQLFQLKYLEEQIRFRIKNAKLGRRQTRQAVEFVCQEHPELKELVLKAFLPK